MEMKSEANKRNEGVGERFCLVGIFYPIGNTHFESKNYFDIR